MADRGLLSFFTSSKKEGKERRPRNYYPFRDPVFIHQKWEKFETERRNIRLQADAVTQPRCIHLDKPATPQTTSCLIRF